MACVGAQVIVDNPPLNKDPVVEPKKPVTKAEVVLYFIPEATVMEGKKVLGSGQRIVLSMTTTVHHLTIIGKDGVKHPLALPVTAGKQVKKFRLSELP